MVPTQVRRDVDGADDDHLCDERQEEGGAEAQGPREAQGRAEAESGAQAQSGAQEGRSSQR